MADSDLSASELRKRYLAGGSLPDDALTAKQLRARFAVPSNSRDFSTRENEGKGSQMGGLLVLSVAVGVVAVVAWMLFGAQGRI